MTEHPFISNCLNWAAIKKHSGFACLHIPVFYIFVSVQDMNLFESYFFKNTCFKRGKKIFVAFNT